MARNLVGLKSQEVREVGEFLTERENSCISGEQTCTDVHLISSHVVGQAPVQLCQKER